MRNVFCAHPKRDNSMRFRLNKEILLNNIVNIANLVKTKGDFLPRVFVTDFIYNDLWVLHATIDLFKSVLLSFELHKATRKPKSCCDSLLGGIMCPFCFEIASQSFSSNILFLHLQCLNHVFSLHRSQSSALRLWTELPWVWLTLHQIWQRKI